MRKCTKRAIFRHFQFLPILDVLKSASLRQHLLAPKTNTLGTQQGSCFGGVGGYMAAGGKGLPMQWKNMSMRAHSVPLFLTRQGTRKMLVMDMSSGRTLQSQFPHPRDQEHSPQHATGHQNLPKRHTKTVNGGHPIVKLRARMPSELQDEGTERVRSKGPVYSCTVGECNPTQDEP